MIIGQPGSGKSTLAREIGARFHLPVVHIDQIHWMPGWVERPKADKDQMARAAHEGPAWVFEGGHSATWPDRLAHADTLIWLDLPLGLRAWRVLKRTLLTYGQTRRDMAPDCPERFSLEFYRWIWDTRHTGREKCAALFASASPEKTCIHLTSPRDVRAFCQSMSQQARSPA